MIKCPQCENDIAPDSFICRVCGFDMHSTAHPGTATPVDAIFAPQAVQPGQTLHDRYLILAMIGQGGMGVVFRARDLMFDEIIALKVLKPDFIRNEQMLSRFKREIKLARRIKHPNVCCIFNFSTSGEVFFITMEFLEGVSLSVLMKQHRYTDDQAIGIIRGIIAALGAAHRLNIIHRDLKPSNVMIDRNFRPVILDFGIALLLEHAGGKAGEEIIGTPLYMSPEALQGCGADQRCDIFSLGVIMYELFTGSLPWPVKRSSLGQRKFPVRPPSTIRPDLPGYLEAIIMRCLEPDPTARFQTVHEILGLIDNSPTAPHILEGNNMVMIAEDEPDIKDLLASALEDYGFTPLFAANGEEAVALATRERPALICMDLMMPRMGGYQAIEFLKANEETSRIPIIVITARQDKESLRLGQALGIQDYITKPFSIIALMKKIRQLVPLRNPRPDEAAGEPPDRPGESSVTSS